MKILYPCLVVAFGCGNSEGELESFHKYHMKDSVLKKARKFNLPKFNLPKQVPIIKKI